MTPAEQDHVKMAVEEYVTNGYFDREEDNLYPWGAEPIEVSIS